MKMGRRLTKKQLAAMFARMNSQGDFEHGFRPRRKTEIHKYLKGSLQKGDIVVHVGKDVEEKDKVFYIAKVEK